MDPAAGRPVKARWQASVVAATGLEADVLSTALLVSGRPIRAMQGRWLVPSRPDRLGSEGEPG
jgi:thiamine biosynthesis lipoprotein ApbE